MGSSQSTASTPSSLAKETTTSNDHAPAKTPPTTLAPSTTTENTPQEESKCPMHQSDGSYSYDWLAVFRPNFPHGPFSAKPLSEEEAKAKIARRATALDGSMASPGGGCPVKNHQQQYNVYSQPIDPTNQMPSNPNQLPAPGQSATLSTERVKSNIPKGGAGDGTTWTYPSPQMFYNALARKGKLDDTKEEEVESVVALHNNMNEKTWKKVLEWEAAVYNEQEKPKLLKFMGRPKDLSPKAWIKHNLLGHPLPFDRHDWTVLRSDGTTVRYVIDYYYDETQANAQGGGMPDVNDFSATPSLLVDVRPALDGPRELLDRALTMPWAKASGSSNYEFMPLAPTPAMKEQVTESINVWQSIQKAASGQTDDSLTNKDPLAHMSEEDMESLAKNFGKALKQCQKAQKAVDQCQSDDECIKASVDLTLCMGKTVCPLQHDAFIVALADDDEKSNSIDSSLERLSECVMMKSVQHEALLKRQEK